MSAREDSGSRSHSRNSNSSTASSGLVPPPTSAAMPPNPNVARFSPLDHVSPEVTQSNPLHQLLQHQPPPLPPAPLAMSSPNQFLQQFLASSSNSMPMANSHMRSMGSVPIPPMSAPSSLLPQFQQNLPTHGAFPPPRSAPLPPSFSQFQPVPSLSATSGGMYPAAPRSATAVSMDGSHSNGAGRSESSSLTGSPRRAGNNATGFGTADASTASPGVRLSGETVEYHPRGAAASGESRSLEVMPITLYNSERTSQLGNLISVNEHFISYPIRNGLIRVISQSSVDRLLLRKHEHHTVTELAFFNSKSELLLSSGTDNHVAIWAIQKDPMSRELIKLVPTQARRVKWHPSEPNTIAIANGSLVFIADLSGVAVDGTGTENLYGISVVCGQDSDHQINDMVFSPNKGECVITAGSDGFVQVYRVQGWQPGQSAALIHRFEPFNGKTVDSLHFYGGNFLNQQGLFIGGESNTRLSLWNAALMESNTPVCYQTVLLRDETRENSSLLHETIFDPTTQFLFVADRSKPLIYAFHLTPSSDARTPRLFDNVTEFALAYPVLSMGLLNRTAQSQPARDGSDLTSVLGGLNFSMQLYCLQTQAIQRYHVAASECYIPGVHSSLEDEIEASENAGQSVGAVTTEGESIETSYQTAAESPRAASAAISAPETEIAEEDEEEEGSNAGQQAPLRIALNGVPPTPLSPARSTRSTRSTGARSLHLTTADDAASVSTSSVTGDIGMLPSLRFYNRSSPSSSVRAFQDESSVQYDPSVDDTASESQQQTLIASLRRMEAAQLQRDEELREHMRGVMGSLSNHLTTQVSTQVEKSIQKQLQSVLVPAMGRIVLHTMENNFMKPVQNGFQHVISEKLIPLMERKLDDSLATSLPDQLANGVDDMVQRVVEDVRQPVRESFRECFQDILIPSFQAATQKMFEQINDTFVQGTRSAFESSGQNTSNAKVASQLEQLTKVVEGLTKQVEQLSLAVNAGGMDVALAPIAKSPEELQLEAQQGTVLDYIARNDWEEAFKFALGAQNVNLVAFTCQQCDPRLVLSSRPPKLSQMLILCLVQQLGADLVDDLETKVNWLRESLLVMDVRDQSIAGFVTSVLQELQTGLNSVPAQSRDSQYTLLHHVLNSMLNSA